MRSHRPIAVVGVLWSLALLLASDGVAHASRNQKSKPKADPYAEYVWPPPPDKARIKLEAVISGRKDVESGSKLGKILIGASPTTPWDLLSKPFGVDFDSKGRVLVTDSGSGALLRIDVEGRRWDVFGTKGAVTLKRPLGLGVGPDDTVYVADPSLGQVVAYDAEGKLKAVYGKAGDFTNPTDAAVSPDGKSLFVPDSKEHRIVVFDLASGAKTRSFGEAGQEPGQLYYPTSVAFGPDGNLYVVDQLNSRVQLFTPAGDFIDKFGELRVGYAGFVRPKDVAVDEVGFIYVSDNALNNIQIFDTDFSLLTFIGSGGDGPGKFHGLSGVAVHGDEIAAVDQLGHRLQIFRFVVPKTGE